MGMVALKYKAKKLSLENVSIIPILCIMKIWLYVKRIKNYQWFYKWAVGIQQDNKTRRSMIPNEEGLEKHLLRLDVFFHVYKNM